MCGIAAYVGEKNAYPIIIEALKRLEYRGYDSAGMVLYDGEDTKIYKEAGAIAYLEKSMDQENPLGKIGIGHTRWATHGIANTINAHPHYSQNKRLTLVHNGTVLNHHLLKEDLLTDNFQFYGETDSEILVNFLSNQQIKEGLSLLETVLQHSSKLEGRSVFVAHDLNDPNKLIACNLGGDLFIGKSKDKQILACSDKNALAGYVDQVISLAPGTLAVIDTNCQIFDLNSKLELKPEWKKLKLNAESLEKGVYPHFMLKEIFEQEEAITKTIEHLSKNSNNKLEKVLEPYRRTITRLRKITIIACGTSWHAGLVAKHFFNELADLPVYCEYASEFMPTDVGAGDLVIAISQSGSTADTLQAVQAAKDVGAIIISICNVNGSAITSLADVSLLTKAGPEIGVASTKAFTTQLSALLLIASQCGQWRGYLSPAKKKALWKELKNIPLKINRVLRNNPKIAELAKKYQSANNFLYLGRGTGFPIAMEGALKLKEVSYIHAEGLSAGEMKHGSIALIDKKMPSLFIAVKDEHYNKIINNLLEIKARNGKIIAVTDSQDTQIKQEADDIINIPSCSALLYPFLTVIPLQLFAYHVALLRGTNIDKPRNLAKSVTVE
jgi:glucosamine--fructose-6-phosphate aminotransferase (isomerizing)